MVHPPNRRACLPAGAVSMGVERIGPRGVPPAPAEKLAAGQGGSGFASLLPAAAGPPSTPETATAGAASPTLAGMAWLQAGIADALGRQARDKQARRHGRAMLQALGAVQLAVLGGDDDRARSALAALACTAEDRHEADDPVLQLILREIAVRAAVELARDEAARDRLATDVSNT